MLNIMGFIEKMFPDYYPKHNKSSLDISSSISKMGFSNDSKPSKKEPEKQKKAMDMIDEWQNRKK
jgi:hypothetical protein